jgi:putative phosphoribosyl transferase
MVFRDRVDAGKKLAEKLLEEGITDSNFRVLGIPRGGVIVAKEVSARINAPST